MLTYLYFFGNGNGWNFTVTFIGYLDASKRFLINQLVKFFLSIGQSKASKSICNVKWTALFIRLDVVRWTQTKSQRLILESPWSLSLS